MSDSPVEKLRTLGAKIRAKLDSRYDAQFIELIDIILSLYAEPSDEVVERVYANDAFIDAAVKYKFEGGALMNVAKAALAAMEAPDSSGTGVKSPGYVTRKDALAEAPAGGAMSCFCHTCARDFHPLGIARHRAAHRDQYQDCDITFSNGDRRRWEYSKRKPKREVSDKKKP